MSKTLKIGVAILLAGIFFIIVAVAMGGNDVYNMTAEKTRKEYTFTGDYTKISLDDYSSNIVVKQSNDDDIHLITNESEDEYYQIQDGAELNIDYISNTDWTKEILTINTSYTDYTNTTELYLPANLDSDLDFSSSYGNVNVSNLQANEVAVGTSSGSISLSNVTANDGMSINTSYGSIDIDDTKATNDAELSTTNGSINIKNSTFGSLSTQATNGKTELIDVISNDDISLDTTNGSITFKNLDFARKLVAASTNGEISGNINGNVADYTFDLSTTLGNAKLNDNDINNKPYGEGNKMVDITTTNGSIDVTCN